MEVKPQEDQVKRERLLEKLGKRFPQMQITTLKKLVKNISLQQSVRSGDKNKLDENARYYEVGLRDIDEHGVITIERCKDKKLGGANNYFIDKYALKENDLLIPYRAALNMKVARVGSGYPYPLVTNASVIRIEMHKETPKELALLIQAYLSIHYVQNYILPKHVHSPEKRFSRRLISTKLLAELPIPHFTREMVLEGGFSEIYLKNLEIDNKLTRLFKENKNLINCLSKDEDETINLFLYHKEKLPSLLEKETYILTKIDQLLRQIETLRIEAGCGEIKKRACTNPS